MYLPDELLVQIFSYSSLENADLAKVALASRRFNKIALPILYSNISLQVFEPPPIEQTSPPPSPPSPARPSKLLILYDTLQQYSELCSYVTTLNLIYVPYKMVDPDPSYFWGVVTHLLQHTTAVRNLTIDPTPFDLDLSNQTRLEELHIVSAAKKKYELSFLKDWARDQELKLISRVLSTPNLRKLRIDGTFRDSAPIIQIQPLFPESTWRNSSVTELYLTQGEGSLEAFMAACSFIIPSSRELKKFTALSIPDGEWLGQIGYSLRMLEMHCSSLEEVFLSYSSTPWVSSPISRKCLTKFTRLRRLAIPEIDLRQRRGDHWIPLPPNLAQLKLELSWGPSSTMDRSIQRIANSVHYMNELYPMLKLVVVWMLFDGPNRPVNNGEAEYTAKMEMLADAFEKSDINFDWMIGTSGSGNPFAFFFNKVEDNSMATDS